MSLLSVETVEKRFGGLRAVDGASLTVEKGSITGLIGPNGAGKTTLFSVIAGFETADAGRVVFEGRDVTRLPAHVRAREGIVRTFQIVRAFSGLDVRENIAVGAFLRHRARADAIAAAEAVAHAVGLGDRLGQRAEDLTIAGKKRLELARALAAEPTLLLLDEVLAGLNPSEIRDMIPVLRAVRERGVTILMVEHVMQAVMALCEDIHVIAQGRIIARGAPAAIARDPVVIEAYLGHGAAATAAAGEGGDAGGR